MPDTTSAREAILGRIQASNQQIDRATCADEYRAIERAYQQSASMDRAGIVHIFTDRLREYDAQVSEAKPANLASVIANILHEHQQKSVAVADTFSESALPEGFHWLREKNLSIRDLNTIEMAISPCEVAIAHTGTIIIRGSRQLTLLPDRLLCIVHENQIVETVPEATQRLGAIAREPLTFISGPSATADIEMTRIRGVHGPRFLDVVIVSD